MSVIMAPPAGLWESAPLVLLEDKDEAAQQLKKRMEKRGHKVHLCKTVRRVKTIAQSDESPRMVFIFDVDMGSGRHEEGLTAVRDTLALKKKGREFVVAVLTSHPEHKQAALDAGADYFFNKEHHADDALEIQMRLMARDLSGSRERLDSARAERAKRGYEELRRRIRSVRSGKPLLQQLAESVEQALSWPGLPDHENLILAAMLGPVRKMAASVTPSQPILNLLERGSDLLAAKDTSFLGAIQWADEMIASGAGVITPSPKLSEIRIDED